MSLVLGSADFDIAFVFARSEAASFRDNTGAVVAAAIDQPRFDHDGAGQPIGLAVSAGQELGGHDRLSIDPLMLPVGMVSGGSEGTVFHHHDPGTGPVRRAYYSRAVARTIDRLLHLTGHHIEIGVAPGFRPIDAGRVHFRGQSWDPPALVEFGAGTIDDGRGRPLIVSGAEPINA